MPRKKAVISMKDELKKRSEAFNEELEQYLPAEEGHAKTLYEACNYAIRDGGKRLRPLFIEAVYELCGGDRTERSVIMPYMAAIEMIHSSSLVHDDLPCMDNDTLRRGRPSTWYEFGEDMGTLAGDGLMIYAFETAAKSSAPADRQLAALRVLAGKTGIFGMIGGQSVDVELTGGDLSPEQIDYIYRLKTGALLEASFMIGALLAGADAQTVSVLEQAALAVGMAFQIEDDILDLTADAALLGKPVGSDEKNGKTTWVTLRGLEGAREDAAAFTDRALTLLQSVGRNDFLEGLVGLLLHREY